MLTEIDANQESAVRTVSGVSRFSGSRRWKLSIWPSKWYRWTPALSLLVIAPLTIMRMFGIENGLLGVLVVFTPFVAVASLGCLVLSLASRSVAVIGFAFVLVAIQATWNVPLYIADDPGSGTLQIRVMTSNLHLGTGDAATVVDLAQTHSVDLLAVEELTTPELVRLNAAGINRLFPYHRVDRDLTETGNGLWARFPFDGPFKTGDSVWPLLQSRIRIHDQTITVVAAHPAAPSIDNHDNRDADYRRMGHVLETIDGEAIVAGDLNASLDNACLRQLLADGFHDAADQSGSGVVRTWPVGLGIPGPFAGIDHVLVRGDALVATAVETATVPHSDHKALIATYQIAL